MASSACSVFRRGYRASEKASAKSRDLAPSPEKALVLKGCPSRERWRRAFGGPLLAVALDLRRRLRHEFGRFRHRRSCAHGPEAWGHTGTAGSCRRFGVAVLPCRIIGLPFGGCRLVDHVEADAALPCDPYPDAFGSRLERPGRLSTCVVWTLSELRFNSRPPKVCGSGEAGGFDERLAPLPPSGSSCGRGIPYVVLSAWNCPRPGTVQ
jgi:hypothetical protein